MLKIVGGIRATVGSRWMAGLRKREVSTSAQVEVEESQLLRQPGSSYSHPCVVLQSSWGYIANYFFGCSYDEIYSLYVAPTNGYVAYELPVERKVCVS